GPGWDVPLRGRATRTPSPATVRYRVGRYPWTVSRVTYRTDGAIELDSLQVADSSADPARNRSRIRRHEPGTALRGSRQAALRRAVPRAGPRSAGSLPHARAQA